MRSRGVDTWCCSYVAIIGNGGFLDAVDDDANANIGV